MAHWSENGARLATRTFPITSYESLVEATRGLGDVCLLILPPCRPEEYSHRLRDVGRIVDQVTSELGSAATLVTIGETIDLVQVHAAASQRMRYQLWIAIKREQAQYGAGLRGLPQHHFGALVHTGYRQSLRHAKTRIQYSYCPICDRTTKDYGGKKHTYHEYGTLISDVWRDIACDLAGDLTEVIARFADLFGIEPYREMRVLDCRGWELGRVPIVPVEPASRLETHSLPDDLVDRLVLGDCLEQLKHIPDNSIDLAFADPPYNLSKKYLHYADDRAIAQYFAWCDAWISELARVIRPGRTCAVLNIPLWAIRHFFHMERILNFQQWIVWDALSFPVRFIMPAHYTVLCFSKGLSRELPGLVDSDAVGDIILGAAEVNALRPLAEGFCLRSQCVQDRKRRQIDDRGPLTDLWWDIHRLKHNTRRVDHPCQVPPQLMYRLISIFTQPGEVVLDCFNGAGTTTLAAQQLSRRYIGIELSPQYHELAQSRHEEVRRGLDPFRKAERKLNAKNSPVQRMPKHKYEVPKKTLQLEVKRIAIELGRLPTREEVIERGRFPIRYYDEYFFSWGEVCAAARTTGMSEYRNGEEERAIGRQLHFLNLVESKRG